MGFVEIFKLYLERSCASPIRLTLHVVFRENPQSKLDDDQPIIKRIREICQHLTRAGRLTIMLREPSWRPLLLPPFLDIGAPDLQHLEVIVTTATAKGGKCDIFSSSAPTNLTYLKMCGWTLPLPLPQWTASLTRLELRRGDSWTAIHNGALFNFKARSLLAALALSVAGSSIPRFRVYTISAAVALPSSESPPHLDSR
ncbi:hypothetical protein C8R47DRAFT_706945 [Mycena vitilis]|nr:hypothetical protein C8R47DRAFT_706945 [Mycena vitilis]